MQMGEAPYNALVDKYLEASQVRPMDLHADLNNMVLDVPEQRPDKFMLAVEKVVRYTLLCGHLQ